MRILKFLFLFFIAFSKTVFAQDTTNTNVIKLGDPISYTAPSIKVTVKQNNVSIDSAVVEIQYKNSVVGMGRTDKEGNCTIKDMPIGSVSVVVKKRNYKTVEMYDIKTTNGKTFFISIELKPDKLKKKGVRLVPH